MRCKATLWASTTSLAWRGALSLRTRSERTPAETRAFCKALRAMPLMYMLVSNSARGLRVATSARQRGGHRCECVVAFGCALRDCWARVCDVILSFSCRHRFPSISLHSWAPPRVSFLSISCPFSPSSPPRCSSNLLPLARLMPQYSDQVVSEPLSCHIWQATSGLHCQDCGCATVCDDCPMWMGSDLAWDTVA